MGKKTIRKSINYNNSLLTTKNTLIEDPVNCACVIHGKYYDFEYVHKLYNGITRNISRPIKLHVYTEPDRVVPEPYIHHPLTDLGVSGPRKSWWYKMQLFNSSYFEGQLLYFDLDVVIVDNIDFFFELPCDKFWGIRDFRYLFNPAKRKLNSSVMYFNTKKFNYVWKEFQVQSTMHMNRMHGDQDFIDRVIPATNKQFFNEDLIKSWRWQLLDGGYDISKRRHRCPGLGTKIEPPTRIMVFHGIPKLHEINDQIVKKHWA